MESQFASVSVSQVSGLPPPLHTQERPHVATVVMDVVADAHTGELLI